MGLDFWEEKMSGDLLVQESSFVVWPLIVAGLFVLLALVALYLSATRVDRTHRDSLCIIIFSAGLTFVSWKHLKGERRAIYLGERPAIYLCLLAWQGRESWHCMCDWH